MSALNIEQLAILLANASMSEKEKEAWLDALPFIPKKELANLQKVLETEQEKIEKIRAKYLKKAEKLIQKKQ